MKNKEQLLFEITKHFEGMNKMQAFDMIHQIEILLFYTSAPIQHKNIKQILSSDIQDAEEIDPFYFNVLPNGNFCELVGSNSWIHIYKEYPKRFNLGLWSTYYFKTKFTPLDIKPLTKDHLLSSIKGSTKEKSIIEFLQKNKVTTKDKISNQLLLLEL